MHIAVLGTGHMATTLAGGFIAAGHTVTFGSRDPEAHTDLAAPVATTTDAIASADLVVSALQAAFALDTLTPLAQELAGKTLVDIGNAVTPSFDLMYPNDSLGERLQAALPDTKVVKALNTVAGTIAVAPGSLSEPTTVFVAGDDADAKALVASLLTDLGWPAETQLDLGGIRAARGMEAYFALFATIMMGSGSGDFNIRVVR